MALREWPSEHSMNKRRICRKVRGESGPFTAPTSGPMHEMICICDKITAHKDGCMYSLHCVSKCVFRCTALKALMM